MHYFCVANVHIDVTARELRFFIDVLTSIFKMENNFEQFFSRKTETKTDLTMSHNI